MFRAIANDVDKAASVAMKKYQTYLYAASLRAFVTVLISVTLLEFLLTFISEITYEAEEAYGFQEALTFLLMTQFSRIYDLSAVVFLVAFLVALGGLANRSELTVLQVTGVTKQQIVLTAATPFVVLALLFFYIAENIAPQLDARAALLKSQWTGEQTAGGWFRQNDMFIYASGIDNDQLRDVLMLQVSEQTLVSKTTAKSAVFDGEQWMLLQGEQVLHQGSSELSIVRFDELQSSISTPPNILNGVMRDPNSLNISELFIYQANLAAQGIATDRLALNLWQRIAQPLLSLALLLVAAGVVFGSSRQVSVSQRVIVGVIIGLSLRVLQDLLNAATLAYQLAPALTSLLPVALVMMAALWSLARKR